MSEVKLVWTTQGQILGSFDQVETVTGDITYVVENPVFVSPGPQGLSMMPLLMFSTETKLTLDSEDLRFGGALFEPIVELRNAYNEQFGSGIQLLS